MKKSQNYVEIIERMPWFLHDSGCIHSHIVLNFIPKVLFFFQPKLLTNPHMKIKTGRGTIPLITLIAIWSVSALTSLPGLAVSPILGDLTKIFPKATDLDIQMLTSLPSLLIIPFILLGGKLTEKVDYVRILKIGLWLFAASGILYLISNKMWQLIVVSALLGIGSGLIIPLSTGLVSRYFVGTCLLYTSPSPRDA